MGEFRVRIMDVDGRLGERSVQAESLTAARDALTAEGLAVVDVAPARDLLPRLRRRATFDLSLFAHELATLLQAGLSLVETLDTLGSREDRRRADAPHARVLKELREDLRRGLSFSSALGRQPENFPALFVATVAATEQTGDLAAGLQRYIRHDEQVSALRNKIISASLYPVMLLLVGGAVALFLLVYLVPRFSGIYENLDTQIPFASRLLMHWGAFVDAHLAIALPALALGIAAAVYGATRPASRVWLMQRVEANRWIGERVRLVRLSRFYRALGLLLRGGIPLLRALQVTAPLLAGSGGSSERVMRGVSEGRPLSACLEENALSTEVASRLLRAGERNGQVADMLERTAQFHDEEVSRWIDAFMKLFEPILMAVIGLVIGAIVVLLYMPIFELASSLK